MKPLFTYSGGKSRLAPLYFQQEPLDRLEVVIEPFGGALGFSCYCYKENKAERFLTRELNPELTELYKWLRYEPKPFIARFTRLAELWNSKTRDERKMLYYYLRERYKADLVGGPKQSVLLLFLLKTKFQGIMQFTKDSFKQNRFNTASGLLKEINIQNEVENLQKWVHALQTKISTEEKDFEDVLKMRNSKNTHDKKILYFSDPPYIDSTTSYNSTFKTEQHELVFAFARNKLQRGLNAVFWIAHTRNQYYEEQAEMLKADFTVRTHYFDYKHASSKAGQKQSVQEMLIVVENKK